MIGSDFCYRAFGLNISSEIPLPELTETTFPLPDVSIRFGNIDSGWESSEERGFFRAGPGKFELHIPNVASYQVQCGQSITIKASSGVDEESIRLFLLGSCMGALLYQSGTLPLHASAVLIGTEGVLISGQSGAGKSTIAFAFSSSGQSVLCDDVAALSIGTSLVVHPGLARVKLWSDAVERFEIPAQARSLVRPNLPDRYTIALESEARGSATTSTLYYIEPTASVDDVRVESITGVKAFQLLSRCIYRPQYANALIGEKSFFQSLADLAPRLSIYRVLRPQGAFDPFRVVEAIHRSIECHRSIS